MRERKTGHAGSTRRVAGDGTFGLGHPTLFKDDVEERAGRQARRIPPDGRGIVGDGHEGARHALRARADVFIKLRAGVGCRHHDERRREGGERQTLPHRCIYRRKSGWGYFGRARSGPTSLCGYPTSTAAATTVVHRPFLSPTAVCVTFWVRTISFDSR